jgi:hypothetical protein
MEANRVSRGCTSEAIKCTPEKGDEVCPADPLQQIPKVISIQQNEWPIRAKNQDFIRVYFLAKWGFSSKKCPLSFKGIFPYLCKLLKKDNSATKSNSL